MIKPDFSRKSLIGLIAGIIIIYLILLIPGPGIPVPELGRKEPFLWNQDSFWTELQNRFEEGRRNDLAGLDSEIEKGFEYIRDLLSRLASENVGPDSPILNDLEERMFYVAADLAACPDRLPVYIRLFGRMRYLIKEQSGHWDMNSSIVRNRIYRLIYGGRAAIEEIMLQADREIVPDLINGDDEESSTPSSEILGVKIHSGDILVSRGGAPTSALIARGNDYPGNFSHVALVYINDQTGQVSIVEAHIELGVTISSIDKYLKDTKLRVMVLRLRSDHPALADNPMLPHEAARQAFERANSEHIPYDFDMNFNDNTGLFCSEVASSPYHNLGVDLWMGISNISSIGVRSWLSAFGVKYFETQEPSDLEYDPQLTVVAEWRDPETLYKDHLDNAVIDVMLEGAEKGDQLEYDWYKLPIARILKVYSVILNVFGAVGPIPEGMPAAAALRNDRFSTKHESIKGELLCLAGEFEKNHGYKPPYWELVKLTRLAASGK